jgi:hypothetical protein
VCGLGTDVTYYSRACRSHLEARRMQGELQCALRRLVLYSENNSRTVGFTHYHLVMDDNPSLVG